MNLPDDLAELERELGERSREEPSLGFRPRVLAAVKRELSWPRTKDTATLRFKQHLWQLTAAGGMAATVIIALSIWHLCSPVPSHKQLTVHLPRARTSSGDELITTWQVCRQALDHSPEALDGLLEKKAAERMAHSTPPRTLLRANSDFLTLNGDL
jgi:hypothetical protein